MGEINTTFFNNLDSATTWSAGVAFKRSKALPLDKYSVFKSKELAIEYAEKTGAYAETPVSYPGQIIAVSENGKMIAYVLTENLESNKLELQQIGVIPAGDNISIKVDENGIISLFGLDTIQEIEDEDGNPITYQPRYENGKLSWVKVGSTTIEDVSSDISGLKSNIQTINEQIGHINKAGYQTENDVKSLIATGLSEINHPVFERVETLPDAENATDNVLYLVPKDGKYQIYAKISNTMVLIDDTDVNLDGYVKTTDLEGYVQDIDLTITLLDYITKKELEDYVTNKDLENYVKAESFSTVLNSLITKTGTDNELTGISTIVDVLIAASKAHEHANKTVLDNISQDDIDKWNTRADLFSKLSNEFSVTEDKTLIINQINANNISGIDDKISAAITEELKDFNGTVLDSISINNTVLKIDENKNVNLPIATATTLGLVYAIINPEGDNKVSINEETNELIVKTVNVNTLTQNKNEFLVLNGGNADLCTETND